MPWFRVDDSFHGHPKVLAAGNAAIGLWLRCGTYSADQITDGFIPKRIAFAYGTRPQVSRLVNSKLWQTVEGGFQMNDYLEYNPSAEKVQAERAAAAERQRRSRRDSHSDTPPRHAVTHASVTAVSRRESHDPDPTRPDPLHNSCTETDNIQPPTESSSSVDIALKIAARATYLVNPHACNAQNPKRYIEGIERAMRLERSIEASELAATGMHPANIAAALTKAPTPAIEEAAINLGIEPPPRKPPRQPCTVCDDTGWITDDPDQRTVTHCPDCTPHNATA